MAFLLLHVLFSVIFHGKGKVYRISHTDYHDKSTQDNILPEFISHTITGSYLTIAVKDFQDFGKIIQ